LCDAWAHLMTSCALCSLAAEPAATITQLDKTLQAAEQLLAPAPGPAVPLAEVAAESPSAAEFEAPSAPTAAPSTPELPHLAGKACWCPHVIDEP